MVESQKNKEKPVQQRRFDSLACLIQGKSPCGAVAFDGEKLLIATNETKGSEFTQKALDYLTFVANKSYQLKGDLEKLELKLEKLEKLESDLKSYREKNNTNALYNKKKQLDKEIAGLAEEIEIFNLNLKSMTEEGKRKEIENTKKTKAKIILEKELELADIENKIRPISKHIKATNKLIDNKKKEINKLKIGNEKEEIDKLKIEMKNKEQELIKEATAEIGKSRVESEFNSFKSAIKKVTNSIMDTYLEPDISEKTLSKEVVEAIRLENFVLLSSPINIRKPNVSGIFFQQKAPDIVTPHAEMKIIQSLFDNKKIDSNSSYYIGITKRCCKNCEDVIKAINQFYEKEVIICRAEGHNYLFRSDIPPFLHDKKDIANTFLDITGAENLFDAFNRRSLSKVPASDQHYEQSISEVDETIEDTAYSPNTAQKR